MTSDSDFKQLVRARMRQTGQNYTAARADLLAAGPQAPVPATESTAESTAESAEWLAAQAEQITTVGRHLRDGRLVSFPARRKARAAVLLDLVALFQPGRVYPEPEVNGILEPIVEDFAFWRRELVNYGYLQRDSGRYRLATTPPVRPAHMLQEIPAWEALWLPRHLTGRS